MLLKWFLKIPKRNGVEGDLPVLGGTESIGKHTRERRELKRNKAGICLGF